MTDLSSDTIAYGRMMHQAMRGLIRRVLSDVAENGLPGEHHFFITFDTRRARRVRWRIGWSNAIPMR